MIRERSSGAARAWMKLYSGTIMNPPNTASATRSQQIRTPVKVPRNIAGVKTTADGPGSPIHHRSRVNKVMPTDPTGTSPSSTRSRDSRWHSSDPTPIPTLNSARNKVARDSSPPSTARV